MGARFFDPYINRFVSPDPIIPQPGNPQSFNRYSYCLGNPLRYRDPTGHWEEEWEEQFEQEHGRPPTEQDWWDYQFSAEIAGWTSSDWVLTYALRLLLYAADVTIKSGDAQWVLSEVEIIGQVVQNITQAFGGDASSIIGGVTIKRMHANQWPLGFAWEPCGARQALGTIRINDSAFAAGVADHVLTHELGHYFQQSQGLIDDFRKATGGYQFNLLGIAQLNLTPYNWGGTPPNEWVKENGIYEDFAASFETFVYYRIGNPIPDNTMGARRYWFFSRFVQ
jgi:hypothetical protein